MPGSPGGALWFGWLLSLLLGAGKFDLAGQVVGTDYVTFYAAGSTLQRGEGARLYDFEYQKNLQQDIVGKTFGGYNTFINPPFFAWLFVPLSLLPYTWSFAIWSLLGLTCLWLSLLDRGSAASRWFGWALVWFPVFASTSFGQNSLLSLGIIKPHLSSLVSGAALAGGVSLQPGALQATTNLGRWIPLAAGMAARLEGAGRACVGGALLAGLSFGLLPDSSRLYLELSRKVFPSMAKQEGFPLWHAHTPRAFWLLLMPGLPALSDALALLSTVTGMVVFLLFRRKLRDEPALLFTGAICLTLWITPHAMIYDWSILLIPAVLLWEKRPDLPQVVESALRLDLAATFLSEPLTLVQLKILPFAVQVSIPVLLFALYNTYRNLVVSVDPAHR